MASTTIMKHTSKETGYQIDHDERKGKTHKNEYINPKFTPENVRIDNRNKQEILDEIDSDVAEFDKTSPPKRKTKDRVTVLEISAPYPREIAPVLPYKPTIEEEEKLIKQYVLDDKEKFVSFGKDADEAIKGKYGKTYGAYMHFDECHYYYNKVDRMYHMSRPHLHTFVTAQAKDGDIVRINGKNALKKSTYTEVNHCLDSVSMKYCGCSYEDGTKQKSRGSVEDVKRDSIRAEQDRYAELMKENDMLDMLKTMKTAEAESIVSDAREEADSILSDARTQASEILKQAKETAKKADAYKQGMQDALDADYAKYRQCCTYEEVAKYKKQSLQEMENDMEMDWV